MKKKISKNLKLLSTFSKVKRTISPIKKSSKSGEKQDKLPQKIRVNETNKKLNDKKQHKNHQNIINDQYQYKKQQGLRNPATVQKLNNINCLTFRKKSHNQIKKKSKTKVNQWTMEKNKKKKGFEYLQQKVKKNYHFEGRNRKKIKEQQYILLQNQFVSINNEKTLQKFYQMKMQHEPTNSSRLSSDDKGGEIDSGMIGIDIFSQQNQSGEEQFFKEQNNIHLKIVQKYIESKVRIIQKWWRKYQQKQQSKDSNLKKQKQNKYTQNSVIKQIQNTISDQIPLNIKLVDKIPIKQLSLNIMNQFSNSSLKNPFDNNINNRIKAIKIHYQVHKDFLLQLENNKQISTSQLHKKQIDIESMYRKQLLQIESIRMLLEDNNAFIQGIEQKTQRVKEAISKFHQGQFKVQLLSQLFEQTTNKAQQTEQYKFLQKKQQSSFRQSKQQEYFQKQQYLQQYEQYEEQQYIPNRQKSTGCHYYMINNEQQNNQKQTIQNLPENVMPSDQVYKNPIELTYDVKMPLQLDHGKKEMTYVEYEKNLNIRSSIEHRLAIQMGIIIQATTGGCINTSILSIHKFLLLFFKYYLNYYHHCFLRYINMPYGQKIQHRLLFLQNHSIDHLNAIENQNEVIYGINNVIDEDIYEQFCQHYYKQSIKEEAMFEIIEYQKIHNKAIFHALNEALNYFRPYYLINGPPYPWNYSEKTLTFYFISDQNIQELFEKTQYKLITWASSLCGVIPSNCQEQTVDCSKDFQQSLQDFDKSTHSFINQIRQQRMMKLQKIEYGEQYYSWFNHTEEITFILYDIASSIFHDVIAQLLNSSILFDK